MLHALYAREVWNDNFKLKMSHSKIHRLAKLPVKDGNDGTN